MCLIISPTAQFCYLLSYHVGAALPGVHYHYLHPDLLAVHPADAARAGYMLLPTVCHPSTGHDAGPATDKGG